MSPVSYDNQFSTVEFWTEKVSNSDPVVSVLPNTQNLLTYTRNVHKTSRTTQNLPPLPKHTNNFHKYTQNLPKPNNGDELPQEPKGKE